MSNIVKFTMNNVPEGLDSMYVRIEESALTQGVRNVLYSGVTPVSGNDIEVNIGDVGTVGNGVIVSANNFTSGGAAFKSMSGYSLIEAGDTPAPTLPTFDYDAVVVLGDSITAGSFASGDNDGSMQQYAESLGIPSSVKIYGTGLSGYSTKTFTDRFVNGVGTSTPNRTLQEYETLLVGKKVLFLSMLGANDLRGFNDSPPEDYEQDFQDQKLEVEQWIKVLHDAIVDSTAFDGSFAIMNFTYVDWREGQDMCMDNLFEIIDGLHPQYDQRRFSNEVLAPLGKLFCAEFMIGDDFVFDMYTTTRNVFRYWFANIEAVHPSVNTSAYIVREFCKSIKQWIDTGAITPKSLDLYDGAEWSKGQTAVVNFNYPLIHSSYIEKPDGLNIADSLIDDGLLSSTLIDNINGDSLGRSYVLSEFTGVGGGISNTGNTTATIDNEFLTEKNSLSSSDKTLTHKGLPANATFDMEVCSSSSATGLSLKVTDNVTGNEAVISDTETTSAGGHKKVTLICQSDANGVMTTTVGSNTGGSFRIAGYSLTRTA